VGDHTEDAPEGVSGIHRRIIHVGVPVKLLQVLGNPDWREEGRGVGKKHGPDVD